MIANRSLQVHLGPSQGDHARSWRPSAPWAMWAQSRLSACWTNATWQQVGLEGAADCGGPLGSQASRSSCAGIGSQLLVYELDTASLRLTHSVFTSAQHVHGFSLARCTAAGQVTLVVYGGRELQARNMRMCRICPVRLLTSCTCAGAAAAGGQSTLHSANPAAAAALVSLVLICQLGCQPLASQADSLSRQQFCVRVRPPG